MFQLSLLIKQIIIKHMFFIKIIVKYIFKKSITTIIKIE
jgi:hypothetical protein